MRGGTWRSLWLGGRDFAVLVAYMGVAIWGLSMYEPWEDEGRAWMIARSFSLWEMLFHILRYEGHPALWYLTLWLPSHLHVPFVAINVISIAIGCAGAWVLLRYSPFAFWLRAVLPFGFWLAYQYSVVAREYVFFPLLGFTAVHLYRRTPARPIWMALALGLLANASVYGALVAIGFAVAYGWKLKRLRSGDGWGRDALLALALFAGAMIFLVICLRPPRDWDTPLSPAVKKVVGHVIPVNYPAMPGRASVALAEPSGNSRDLAPETRLATRLSLIFSYPIFNFWVPSIVLELLTIALVVRRGEPLLLVSLALLIGFMGTVYCKIWHAGMVWVTLIMLAWAAWDETQPFRIKSLQGAVTAMLAAAGILQVAWTAGAIRYESKNSIYPAEAAANYLKTLPRGTTLDGNGFAFTILPYFFDNPFTSYDSDRYRHHDQRPDDENLTRMAAFAPDVILLRGTDAGQPQDDDGLVLESAGYRLTHTFCGSPYFPDKAPKPTCLITFNRSGIR